MSENLIYGIRVAASLLLLTLCALFMATLALATLFLCRRCYAEWLLNPCGRLFLRLWGLRMEVHQHAPYPNCQTVFVMNHTSSVDMFVIVALGLINTRFFLSGYLRMIPPLAVVGYLTGTFWTVDQIHQARRVRIFQRACRILKRSGESVCLSPEGIRITTGEIGPFNKGAFHLAAALRAPMQPIYIHIPKGINPGTGWHARPGTIQVHIAPPVDTSAWREKDAMVIKEEMRAYYCHWKKKFDD